MTSQKQGKAIAQRGAFGKRAGTYARVSTDDQAKKGYSLPTQLEACRQYAQSHGFTVVVEFADDCSGSIPIAERPEGGKLYKLIAQGELDAVIIFTHDRTARDEGMVEYLLFKDHLHTHNVELHYSDTGLDADTLEAKLVGNIKSYLAAAERQEIRERTMRGRNAKAQDNHVVMGGSPPYGYRREGKFETAKLVIYDAEARIVKLIFVWYVYGDASTDAQHGEGPLSARAIAIKLNEQGEQPPHYRKDAAGQWRLIMVRRILSNEIYAGRTHFGKVRIVDHRQVKQPHDEWIPIEVPALAIVDRDLFAAAQVRAKRNVQLSRRHQKREYLLSGFIRCAECGGVMSGRARPEGDTRHPPLYRCGNYWRASGTPCPKRNRTVSAKIAEALAWDWLIGLLQDEKKLEKGLRAMEKQAASETEPKQQRLEQVRRLMTEVEAKVKRLVSTIGDETDETIAAALKNELKTYARQIESCKAETQALEKELAQTQVTPERKEQIKRRAKLVREKLTNPTFAQKRSLFDATNFQATLRIDEDGRRWLDVKCGLGGGAIALHSF